VPAQTWEVEVLSAANAWVPQHGLSFRTVDFAGHAGEPAHRVYTQPLHGLPPGGTFFYRVRLDGRTVFQNPGKALKDVGQRQVVAIAGDLVSTDHAPTKRVADRIMAANPDLMIVPGDIVNLSGHAQDYRNAFFPIYNADAQGPATGAPLMRNLVLVGCLGNNDTDRVLEPRSVWPAPKVPGSPIPKVNGLAYYYYFDQPLNGPTLALNDGPVHQPAAHTPYLHPRAAFQPFLDAAGNHYPNMGNFSFDSGDVHWVVLDSNYYMDWSDPALQAWLQNDLAMSAATWKIAVFHYPVFNLATWYRAYRNDDGSRMRQLWPIFQANGVDLTFSGHIHTYQRTRPFTFVGPLGRTPATSPVPNYPTYPDTAIVEDTAFTGAAPVLGAPPPPAPHGIISIISGGGGAHLRHMNAVKTFHALDPGHHPVAFVNAFGFSLLEIEGKRLNFRQISDTGVLQDEFVIVKP